MAYCLSKHIKNSKITKTDNIFLKPFVENKNLYYVDIYLSKFSLYETVKNYYNKISDQFSEFVDIVLSATENNTRKVVMTTIAPKPQDIMQMLPMLLNQRKPTFNANKNQAHIDVHSDIHMDIPVSKNPLLYDSDNDDLTVD